MGHITDWQPENAQEAYARTVSAADSKIGDAANWAMDKAKDTLESAADQIRERATTAVATYTKENPIRAILTAAGLAFNAVCAARLPGGYVDVPLYDPSHVLQLRLLISAYRSTSIGIAMRVGDWTIGSADAIGGRPAEQS